MPVTRIVDDTKKKLKKPWFYAENGFDLTFFLLVLILLVVGLVCMFSASYVYAYYWDDDSYYYIKRQLIFALIGVVAMIAISFVDYHKLHKFAFPAMIASWALLVVALVTPSSTGVHRWIRLGSLTFQPSEVAKFAVVLVFAHMISLNYKKMKKFTVGFLPFILLLGGTCALVFIEPHLSGTVLILGIGLVMMYVGGTRQVYLLGLIGIGVAVVLYMVFGMGYEADRIFVWQDPLAAYKVDKDAAWQTVQSLYAIGSGGVLGQGLGNSRQKHLFLPEPQNDFVFSIVCEELGLVGAVLIILLFAALLWRGFTLAMKAPDKFGMMLVIGLTAQVGIQTVLNMAVVTNLIPNTGISLPFFSYGGTSLVMLLAQMGVILSVTRQMALPATGRKRDKERAESESPPAGRQPSGG